VWLSQGHCVFGKGTIVIPGLVTSIVTVTTFGSEIGWVLTQGAGAAKGFALHITALPLPVPMVGEMVPAVFMRHPHTAPCV